MSTSKTVSGGAQRPLALVTGGARRVGRASALALARAGCDVMITYKGSERDALATIAEIVELGGNRAVCRATKLGMDDPANVETAGARLAKTLPRLDILVHNASSYERTPLDTLTPEQAMSAFRVNALAPLLLTKHLAPLLSRSGMPGGGSIVAMCDIHALGEHGLPRSSGFLAYAMSKSALAEMVRTLARELAPKVRVNAVAPGVAAWPESGHESDAAAQEAYVKRVPLGRAGTPDECAQVVRWLAMDATYTTGEIIRFDGGRTLV